MEVHRHHRLGVIYEGFVSDLGGFTWFYMVFIWFYMVLYGFYMVFIWFYMVLYGFIP